MLYLLTTVGCRLNLQRSLYITSNINLEGTTYSQKKIQYLRWFAK